MIDGRSLLGSRVRDRRFAEVRRYALLASLALGCHAALADIQTFNEAVRRGDYQTAAAQTAEIWSGLDKTTPGVATVAREFGFISYLAGRYEQADTYATFLVERDRSAIGDDQPATSETLHRLIRYRLDPGRRTRSRLLRALDRRASTPGLDAITVTAAETLYQDDWQASNWPAARRSSELAGELLSRGGQALLPRAMRARLLAAAAEFFQLKRPPSYEKMASLHDALVDSIEAEDDADRRSALRRLRWQAAAWSYAIESWFDTYYIQTGSHVDTGITPRKLDLRRGRSEASAPPRCEGRLAYPPIRLPDYQASLGKVGAVILAIRFDDAGAAVDSEVLAAAPADTFNAYALKKAPTFRRTTDPAGSCGSPAGTVIVPILFNMDYFQGGESLARVID